MDENKLFSELGEIKAGVAQIPEMRKELQALGKCDAGQAQQITTLFANQKDLKINQENHVKTFHQLSLNQWLVILFTVAGIVVALLGIAHSEQAPAEPAMVYVDWAGGWNPMVDSLKLPDNQSPNLLNVDPKDRVLWSRLGMNALTTELPRQVSWLDEFRTAAGSVYTVLVSDTVAYYAVLPGGELNIFKSGLAPTRNVSGVSYGDSYIIVDPINTVYALTNGTVSGTLTNAPKGRCSAVWCGRLFIGGTNDNPSRLNWCEISLPDSWSVNAYMDFDPGDGGAVVAMVPDGNVFWVLKTNGLYCIEGTWNPNTWKQICLTKSLGCVSGRSAVWSPYGTIFAGTDGLYLLSTGQYSVSQGKVKLLSKDIEDVYLGLRQVLSGSGSTLYWLQTTDQDWLCGETATHIARYGGHRQVPEGAFTLDVDDSLAIGNISGGGFENRAWAREGMYYHIGTDEYWEDFQRHGGQIDGGWKVYHNGSENWARMNAAEGTYFYYGTSGQGTRRAQWRLYNTGGVLLESGNWFTPSTSWETKMIPASSLRKWVGLSIRLMLVGGTNGKANYDCYSPYFLCMGGTITFQVIGKEYYTKYIQPPSPGTTGLCWSFEYANPFTTDITVKNLIGFDNVCQGVGGGYFDSGTFVSKAMDLQITPYYGVFTSAEFGATGGQTTVTYSVRSGDINTATVPNSDLKGLILQENTTTLLTGESLPAQVGTLGCTLYASSSLAGTYTETVAGGIFFCTGTLEAKGATFPETGYYMSPYGSNAYNGTVTMRAKLSSWTNKDAVDTDASFAFLRLETYPAPPSSYAVIYLRPNTVSFSVTQNSTKRYLLETSTLFCNTDTYHVYQIVKIGAHIDFLIDGTVYESGDMPHNLYSQGAGFGVGSVSPTTVNTMGLAIDWFSVTGFNNPAIGWLVDNWHVARNGYKVPGLLNKRWCQFKAVLETGNNSVTPHVQSIMIDYGTSQDTDYDQICAAWYNERYMFSTSYPPDTTINNITIGMDLEAIEKSGKPAFYYYDYGAECFLRRGLYLDFASSENTGVYRLDSGYNDAGETIEYEYETKDFDFGSYIRAKTISEMFIRYAWGPFDGTATNNLTFGWSIDRGLTWTDKELPSSKELTVKRLYYQIPRFDQIRFRIKMEDVAEGWFEVESFAVYVDWEARKGK